MEKNYILSIDQSTQGTKAILFDGEGMRFCRSDILHRQMVDEKGWVEHDPIEIIDHVYQAVKDVVAKSGIDKRKIAAIGITNQRETAMAWEKDSGKPLYNAIVWQCARGATICEELERQGCSEIIKAHTGLHLSPYFSGAKLSWILKHVPGVKEAAGNKNLCMGTMDSWLLYCLTDKKRFCTDMSNASRTQLFNIRTLAWDEEICGYFQIPADALPEICDSNANFGYTDFAGLFQEPVPICCMLGDSHAALYGQGCIGKGMIKATYGTGSSIMMNTGEEAVFSKGGTVTSLAWSMDGNVNYVLEGNINYTGAVISWLIDDVGLIVSAGETEDFIAQANPMDKTYLVPAFTGLGAPYWTSDATGTITGMTRMTGKNELVKAAVECIAYQIADVVEAMQTEAGILVKELRVDGGPTANCYLMQFQSDILNAAVKVPDAEELSGIGAAYAAGIRAGLYQEEKLFADTKRECYAPSMSEEVRGEKKEGWHHAVKKSFPV